MSALLANRRYLLPPLLLLAGFALVLTEIYRVPPPQSGSQLRNHERTTGPLPDRFTVATYNIHSGKGLQGRTPLSVYAELLRKPPADIVGLNEVKTHTIGTGNQAGDLAALLGTSWLYAPTAERFLARAQGNAALSNIAIDRFDVEPLLHRYHDSNGTREGNSHRNLITLTFGDSNNAVVVLITHLDRGPLRHMQLAAVIQRFQSYPRAVLLGDLNSVDAELRPLLDGVTEDAVCLEQAGEHIDHILVRGLLVEASGEHPVGPSDHPQYWAKLARITPPGND